jgi:hypothetical protein
MTGSMPEPCAATLTGGVQPFSLLSQDEIFAAIRAGKLQYRPAANHGNP